MAREKMTQEEYDKACNDGLAKLEEMRHAGLSKSQEYTDLLYRLRKLTHDRLIAFGLEASPIR